jgi:PAS domain S-box-containing protein
MIDQSDSHSEIDRLRQRLAAIQAEARSEAASPRLRGLLDQWQTAVDQLVTHGDAASRQELAASNRLLETIIAATPMQVVYLDRDFNFVRVNPAYARACARTAESMIGRNHFELYPHAENEAIFRRVVQTGESFFVQAKPFVFPDHPEWGTTYWDWSLVPTKDDTGYVTGLVFTLVDVTPRRRAELEVESVARFPEENPDPVMRVDADGRVQYANLPGRALLERLNCGVGQPAPALWLKSLTTTHAEGGTTIFETEAGGRTYSMCAVAISHGSYVNLYGHDITLTRQAEEDRELYLRQLAVEESKLEAIIHSAPEGIVVADDKGRVIMLNPAAEELYGYQTPQQVDGGDFCDPGAPRFCYSDGRPYRWRDMPLVRAALDGETTANFEIALIWSDDQRRSLLHSAAPIRDAAGKITGAVGIFQDISEQHQFQAELARRAHQLETLVREAHHRIRNNLQSIVTLLEVERSRMDAGSQESLDRCISRIRAIAMVHRLLTTETTSNVPLQDMLRGLAELARATNERGQDNQIDVLVTGGGFTVGSKVATSLAIVINELIANAMEHAFAGRNQGHIRIAVVGQAGGPVEIAVEDNGRGCPLPVPDGTGLPIARSIVESDLGGQFYLENLDQGCRCRLRFNA